MYYIQQKIEIEIMLTIHPNKQFTLIND